MNWCQSWWFGKCKQYHTPIWIPCCTLSTHQTRNHLRINIMSAIRQENLQITANCFRLWLYYSTKMLNSSVIVSSYYTHKIYNLINSRFHHEMSLVCYPLQNKSKMQQMLSQSQYVTIGHQNKNVHITYLDKTTTSWWPLFWCPSVCFPKIKCSITVREHNNKVVICES